MDTIKIALLAVGGLLTFTACDTGTSLPDWGYLDTGDTGYSEVIDPVIAEVSYSCSYGSPDSWWFTSRTDGWAGLAVLDIFETGDGHWPSQPSAVWKETHTLNNSDYDQGGEWDEWSITLRHVTTIGQQVSGQSTLFGCEWNDGGSLAFMETIYDDTGREQDCVIWGYQSQQYFNSHLGNSCVCLDNDGSCSN
jgi:hypothetical protein